MLCRINLHHKINKFLPFQNDKVIIKMENENVAFQLHKYVLKAKSDCKLKKNK